jgi:hypothetical protein
VAIRKSRVTSREERRTLLLVVIITCIPVIGATWAIVATSAEELSDLVPLKAEVEGYTLLGWPDLIEKEPGTPSRSAGVREGAPVRILGYMMDSDSRNDLDEMVCDFILLPDAGHLLHPAHRFGDQMIAVHLQPSDCVTFTPRSLVWAFGNLRIVKGNPIGPVPLYHLDEASANAAPREDIRRFFK